MKNWRTIEKAIRNKAAIKGECFFCHKKVDGGFYCFGCKEFVCEDCYGDYEGIGFHSVEVHKKRVCL